jgi:putative SOS response-associated peptidase YedK
MCFYFRASEKVLKKLEKEYDFIDEGVRHLVSEQFNGFQHPATPVVTNREPGKVQAMSWGLIPYWAKDRDIQNNTLNARMESLSEKPSFKYSLGNRCLIYADGFYEWQWLDPQGKKKQKYLVTLEDEQPFCFAGLWSSWKEPGTDQILNTYTIITRPANELMSRIHNSKQRMPWILPEALAHDYLQGLNVTETEDHLKASCI